MAEKVDRKEFIDLLKRMLTLDQERRITPGEALNHPFITMAHLVEYAPCNMFKQSLSAMEICRRPVKSIFDVNQNATSIMSNLVPPSTSNLTVSFNNQINALHTQMATQNLSGNSLRVQKFSICHTPYSHGITFPISHHKLTHSCQHPGLQHSLAAPILSFTSPLLWCPASKV